MSVDPVVPRPAATLLLIRDDPLEVLMVRRHAGATFASALVFPGGVVDPEDASPEWLPLLDGADGLDETERALRIAALRETHEETGLLIAPGSERRAQSRDPQSRPFIDAVREADGRLALDEVVPFGHWITPADRPKRFDTHFYLCLAPAGAAPVCDGAETVALEWVAPQGMLERFDAGERSIMFPTRMNLKRLAESPDTESALRAARARSIFTVEPQVRTQGERVTVTIPAEAGYGETEDFHPRLR